MSSIGYKDMKVLRSLFTKAWHPKLIALLLWMVVRYSKDPILFTQGYEKRNYPSPHDTDPLQAFDLRSGTFEDPEAVVADVNSCWVYDRDRPDMKVAIYHDTGRGIHLHLQVCFKTEYIGGQCDILSKTTQV